MASEQRQGQTMAVKFVTRVSHFGLRSLNAESAKQLGTSIAGEVFQVEAER